MYSSILSIALFGASALAQSSTASASSASQSAAGSGAGTSAAGSGTAASGTTSTVTGTVPAVGAVSNGPAEIAASYCMPSSWSGPATDTPCYSMQVLNEACFFGPTVIETATATPTSNASPAEQQQCYCNEQTGAGFMYFQFMAGCSKCFREHGSDGGPGAYGPDFISSLSSSYCGQATPSVAFGKFLTSFGGSTAVATKDLATSTVLGTETAVSLYFTTVPTGGFATNSTINGTASATSSSNSTSVLTSSVVGKTTSAGGSSSGGSSTASASASQSSSGAGAGAIQVSGLFGAMIVGFAAML